MRAATWTVVWSVIGVLGCGPTIRHSGDDTACDGSADCTICEPGTGTCNGNQAHTCNASGTGYEDFTCDPLQGSTCDAGACTGACAPQNLGTSYIGCEYYPTVTGNMVDTGFNFAVAVANTTNDPATVTVDDGGLTTPITFTVMPNSVQVQTLPWNALKLCLGTLVDCGPGVQTEAAQIAKGAFHLRSTTPVTVYQFNPLEYFLASAGNSITNDASLLLPTNVWNNDYVVAAWPNLNGPGLLAVTAQRDNTQVTLTTTASTGAGGGAPAFAAGTPQTVTLNAGDVLEVSAAVGDLTGSRVTADKPTQVMGGHYCANVPLNMVACDHLEESMFSIDALGRRYIVNAPAVTTIPNGKVETVRIVATQPNTTLTYDPPQPGAPTTIAAAGGFVEIPSTAASFLVEGSEKILVAQYMSGQSAGGGTGDPAMALAVPVDQFRTNYLFHAPTNYESNYVDVTAPMNETVMLDGVPLVFTPIGGTGYGLARVYPLNAGPGNDGNHSISGSAAFGITVYGYGQYTSYWYPGGLNLTSILE